MPFLVGYYSSTVMPVTATDPPSDSYIIEYIHYTVNATKLHLLIVGWVERRKHDDKVTSNVGRNIVHVRTRSKLVSLSSLSALRQVRSQPLAYGVKTLCAPLLRRSRVEPLPLLWRVGLR